ncbi:MAG TPA: cation:proton antiporter [Microbacterium sp.]|uniref:cation:proton antiporter n=1 Tax=Microbacterium sp. TaxID=51671 RepID=UPI002B4960F9|nr:cation:proton antiporter [Microbacterium sp.]HKT57257.1 cation:proton antiporter [Microbacterium sp.]
MLLALILLVAVIAIAVVTSLAQRLGVAGPLMLVALGLVVGLMPFVHLPEIPPSWILAGVLPPLLYSSAVNLPALEFRRDLRPIMGLSVLLVVMSSVLLGLFFWVAIPSVGLPLGIALGAIISPTDAVATSIAKRLGIAPRVVTMLEGESLLNDATALVLLRTAIVAIAGSFSLWGAVGAFLWGILIAVVVGGVVGWLLVKLRGLVRNSAASTAIGFTVPFLAYLPAEELHGSGLVAAVVAGIVAGQGAPRLFTPEQRLSDRMTWHTVELVLEGAIFLLMGLELKDIVGAKLAHNEGLWTPIWVAAVALVIVVASRTAYVTVVVWIQGRHADRMNRDAFEKLSRKIDKVAAGEIDLPQRRRAPATPEEQRQRVRGWQARVTRALNDIDYYQSTRLGWKHGAVIVWAGMRGAVTLAAAQTLTDAQTDGHRALLVFVAFLVAVVSLMLQGFTLPWLVRRLHMDAGDATDDDEEHARLFTALWDAGQEALADPGLVDRAGNPFPAELLARMQRRVQVRTDDEEGSLLRTIGELRLVVIDAQRRQLGALARGGEYSSAELRRALNELDAEQLSLQVRLGEE